MKYLFLLFTLILTSPAMAEFNFDDGVRKPNSMLVAGDSVIDDTDEPDVAVSDDADDFTDPEKTAPAMVDVDAFATPPIATPRPNVKRVVKTTTDVKIQRSIADDRIDDSYVQGLLKRRNSFTSPIE